MEILFWEKWLQLIVLYQLFKGHRMLKRGKIMREWAKPEVINSLVAQQSPNFSPLKHTAKFGWV
jgi:hypothetical protein